MTRFYGIGRGRANKLYGNGIFANFGGGLGTNYPYFSYFIFFLPDLVRSCISNYLPFYIKVTVTFFKSNYYFN
jgi:hypothetical protein